MNKGYPSRKSLPQIVEAFAAFRARHDDALLYLHTDLGGAYQEGIDLAPLLHAFELDPEIVRFPDQYRYQFDPVRDEHLADVYSSLDVLLNPAMGEGFGLPVLEAQACGVPAIVTDFTAMSEVCGAGWKVGYDRVWTPMRAWQAWPNVEEIVESLEACYALSGAERGASSSARPASTRCATTPTACSRSTGCRRSTRSSSRLADRRPLTDRRRGAGMMQAARRHPELHVGGERHGDPRASACSRSGRPSRTRSTS